MTGGRTALWCAAAATVGAAAGWMAGAGTAHDLQGEIAGLRGEVQRLAVQAEAAPSRPDADTLYVTGEIARFKATLARQRFAIEGAMTDEKDAAEQDAMRRALGTIDAVAFDLQQVTDPDGLARWFNTTMTIKQRWPSQHAWLLPDLQWR